MDPANLIVQTTLDIAGWLSPEDGSRSALTPRAVHQRLIKMVRSGASQAGSSARAQRLLRSSLIAEINALSLAVIMRAPAAIEAARRSGATYLMEFDPHGGSIIRERYTFAQLPFIGQAKVAFDWMAQLRLLAPPQQMLVIQGLDLEFDLRNSAVHLKFADDDGDSVQFEELSVEVSGLTHKLNKLHSSMGAEAVGVKTAVLKLLSVDELLRLRAVVEATAKMTIDELRTVATWMDVAGDSLIQPLPLAKRTKLGVRNAATVAWQELKDLRDTLHVLAIWLRSLVDTEQSLSCQLCYRHLGLRGKVFCAAHQRVDGKRQPAKEFHVARRFLGEVESLSESEAGLKEAIDRADAVDTGEAQSSAVDCQMGVNIPDSLSQPAGVLQAALRRASPATGVELKGHIDDHFRDLIRVASEPLAETRTMDLKEFVAQRIRQEQARRWLTWNTFFTGWYGPGYHRPGSVDCDLRGLGFDIDHPIVHGNLVSRRAVVLDLLRQRAWVRAERKVDAEDYVNMDRLKQLAAPGRSHRSIGLELGVSHETVRQRLADSADPGPTEERRPRILPKAKTRGVKPRGKHGTRPSRP